MVFDSLAALPLSLVFFVGGVPPVGLSRFGSIAHGKEHCHVTLFLAYVGIAIQKTTDGR